MANGELQALIEKVRSRSDDWSRALSQWYLQQWESALSGSEPPSPQEILSKLDPEIRPSVEAIICEIDANYRNRWESRGESNIDESPANTAWLDRKPEEATAEPIPQLNAGQTIAFQGDLTDKSRAGSGKINSGEDVTLGATVAAGELRGAASYDMPTIASAAAPKTSSTFAVDKSKRNRNRTPTPLPKRIGSYDIENELGRGGMGVVYLARQKGINRLVALKMILVGKHANSDVYQRFFQEAQTIGKLQHENIVRVYEVGMHDELPYVSLEFIDGPTLEDCLRQETLSPNEAARLLQQVAKGMEFAHQRNVIHRDIKPANILLTSDGTAKISDFGLAKQLDSDSELSRVGIAMGTPSFMAPEQALGSIDVGPAADVYALGATLYCMLTSRPPFVGSNATETMCRVLRDEPVPPRQLKPDIPLDIDTICLKCLSKEPQKRYESAQALADELGRFLRGEPILARPVSRVERVWRWCRRNPNIAIPTAAAACLALCLAIGGPVAAGVIYQQKKSTLEAKQLADSNALAAREAEKKAKENAAAAAAAEVIAKQNEQAAMAAKAETEVQKKEAEKSAELAQSQNKVALDTLRQVTFAINRELKDRPRLQALRTSLIGEVKQGLDRTKSVGFDPQATHMIAAGTYSNLGRLNLDIGRPTAAMDDFKRCLEVFDQLESVGKLPNALRNRAQIHVYMGEAAKGMGNLGLAEQHFGEALKFRTQWLDSTPLDDKVYADIEQNVAGSLGDLGNVYLSAGRLTAAKEYYEKALRLREKWVAADANSSAAAQALLGSHWSLARVAFQAEQWDTAFAEQTKVIEQLRQLSRYSDLQSHTWNLALALQDLGKMHLYQDQLVEADKCYGESVEKLRELVAADPENYVLKDDLAGALYGLATVQLHAQHPDRASTLYAECHELRKLTLEIEPENLRRRITLALTLARTGNHVDSLTIANQVLQEARKDVKAQFDLAGAYTQIAEAMSHDDNVKPDAIEPHMVLARELIDSAKSSGYARLSDLQRDPDLLPLRRDVVALVP